MVMAISEKSIVIPNGQIAEFNCRFPGIEIYLREGFEDDVKEDVRSGVVDFGVGDLRVGACAAPVASRTQATTKNSRVVALPHLQRCDTTLALCPSCHVSLR